MLEQFLNYWPRTYFKVAGVAFLVSLVGTPILIVLLRRFGILDPVRENKLHERPVPRGGGIIIFLSFAIAVVIPYYFSYPMKGIVIGGFICMVVGAIDDWRGGIPAVWKFATLVLVTLILAYYGVHVKLFGNYILDEAVTLVWVVGVVSAFNGIDNMDGLASGTGLIVSAMYLTIAMQAVLAAGTETSLSWFGLLAAALIGANLGFLVYNFKPARIFMGDSGSFFLGFTLAALGVMGEWTENQVISCTIPMLILGVPLFDFSYIIIARMLRGETRTLRDVIEHCGLDHLSHRLVWMGFTQRQAVLFIYLISMALGLTGILLRNSRTAFDSAIGLLQGMAILVIVMTLMAMGAHRHESNGRREEKDEEMKEGQ